MQIADGPSEGERLVMCSILELRNSPQPVVDMAGGGGAAVAVGGGDGENIVSISEMEKTGEARS